MDYPSFQTDSLEEDEAREVDPEKAFQLDNTEADDDNAWYYLDWQQIKVWLKRFGDYLLGPSPNSRMSRLVLRSRENVYAERQRQLKYNRFIIHPFSRFQ